MNDLMFKCGGSYLLHKEAEVCVFIYREEENIGEIKFKLWSLWAFRRITSGPCTYGMVIKAYLSYTWRFWTLMLSFEAKSLKLT